MEPRGGGAEGNGLCPPAQPGGGAARPELPPAQPPLLMQCPLVRGRAVIPRARRLPVPCGARCSGRAGCWPPAAWFVPRAAAATAAAPAGTTPAGPPVPAGLTATATRTARGRETAARTTWPRVAVPVSGGGDGTAGLRLGTPACGAVLGGEWLLLPD